MRGGRCWLVVAALRRVRLGAGAELLLARRLFVLLVPGCDLAVRRLCVLLPLAVAVRGLVVLAGWWQESEESLSVAAVSELVDE